MEFLLFPPALAVQNAESIVTYHLIRSIDK
jgi:hypothetical protein